MSDINQKEIIDSFFGIIGEFLSGWFRKLWDMLHKLFQFALKQSREESENSAVTPEETSSNLPVAPSVRSAVSTAVPSTFAPFSASTMASSYRSDDDAFSVAPSDSVSQFDEDTLSVAPSFTPSFSASSSVVRSEDDVIELGPRSRLALSTEELDRLLRPRF